jgi:hypothetical protein
MVHLTTKTSHNIKATLIIQGEELAPKESIRVLGLQIDPKLQWGPHVTKLKIKMATQTLALSRIASSTWGPAFRKCRLIHRTVISPALTFAAEITHSPRGVGRKRPMVLDALQVMQNKSLRVVTGAFKATPIDVLHAEMEIQPLEVYLDELQAGTRCRMAVNGADDMIAAACRRIRDSVGSSRGRPRHPRPATLGTRKANWARSLLEAKWYLTPSKVALEGPRPTCTIHRQYNSGKPRN